MFEYVTIAKCAEMTGYTEDAIRTKIRDGVWMQDKVWAKALDGRQLIIIEGYNKWVETAMALGNRQKRAMKSPLPIKAKDAAKESRSSPAPLTAAA